MLDSAQLAAYCARIGIAVPVRADRAVLDAVHAAHCAAIPFENLDVQLGLLPSRDLDAVHAKLVGRRRGGWCHEHNTLLGAALAAMGFAVSRVSAGVIQPDTGLPMPGSHLALTVMLDRRYLVDGGFGSWIAAPLPLIEGEWPLVPFPARLAREPDARWRLAVDIGGHTMAYVFADAPADEALLAATCRWQASAPASIFVQNLVVQRRCGATDLSLRGRVLVETGPNGVHRSMLHSGADLVAVLAGRFGLDVPQAADLWGAVVARHAALFGDQDAPTT